MRHKHFAPTFITSCIGLGICLGALASFSSESPQNGSSKKQEINHSISPQPVVVTPKPKPNRIPAIAQKPLKFDRYYYVSSAKLGCERFFIDGFDYHAAYLEADGQKYSINGVGSYYKIMPSIDELPTKEAIDILEEMDFLLVLQEEAEKICVSKYPDTAEMSDWYKIRENTGFHDRN